MSVSKSTRHGWIVGVNPLHLEEIERINSRDRLISSSPEKKLTPKRTNYYTVRLPRFASGKTDNGETPGCCYRCEPENLDVPSSSSSSSPSSKNVHASSRFRPTGDHHASQARCRSEEHCGPPDKSYFQIQEPPPKSLKDQEIPQSRRACKNLLVLGCAFMFVLTAFVSLQSLQSTLNARQGLGVVSLSCVYGATVLSCFIAPAVIKKLTTKWTITLAYLLFMVYVAANFYPNHYVMIPASIMLGLLTGPLWSAQSTYLTTLALRYAQAADQLQDVTINKFNGVFCGILQTSQVWGNLLSALVLSSDNKTVELNRVNKSLTRHLCGAKDCGLWDEFPDYAVPHFAADVPAATRNMLLAIQLGCVVIAVSLITTLLDRNHVNVSGSRSLSLSSQQLFLSTVRILQDPRLQLLVPLVTFTGLEQGFVLGDFTKSYVNCALGVHKIGFVMVCFGAVNAGCSVCIGHIAKHLKRYPIMVAGSLFNAGLLLVLLWWRPCADDVAMFYVISSCLGLCDAIWQTQTNTLFGVLFYENQEAAFASYRMFQAVGFAVAFGYSHALCVHTKVYIMAVILVMGLVLYSVIEFKLHQQKTLREGIVVL